MRYVIPRKGGMSVAALTAVSLLAEPVAQVQRSPARKSPRVHTLEIDVIITFGGHCAAVGYFFGMLALGIPVTWPFTRAVFMRRAGSSMCVLIGSNVPLRSCRSGLARHALETSHVPAMLLSHDDFPAGGEKDGGRR